MTIINGVNVTGGAISSPPRKRLRPGASVSLSTILNCEVCGKPYKTKAGLDNHMVLKHDSLSPSQASASLPVSIENSGNSYYCLECDKTYKFQKAYDKHMAQKH